MIVNDFNQIEPKIKKFAICPFCNETTSSVDHLIDKNTNVAWYCDHCGGYYKLEFRNGKMFIAKTEKRKDKTLVLLEYKNILLMVEGIKFNDIENESSDEYYYNEGTCPTNYLKNIVVIIDMENMDSDPHGVFTYIKTISYDEDMINHLSDVNYLNNLIRK